MDFKKLASWIVLLTVGLGSAGKGYPQAFLTNGLVAYYPLNGNANDATGNGNDGAISNVVFVADRFGNTNGAAYFAGNASSKITINSTNLNLTPAVTVSAWINFPAGVGTYGPRVFSSSGFEIGTSTTGSDRLAYANEWGGPTADSSNTISAGNWWQIVGVCDGTQMLIYVNGNVEGSAVLAQPPSYDPGILPTIAENAHDGLDNFGGSVNDIRVYNRALSSNEVAELYAIESTPPPPIITSQPASITNKVGDNVFFSVSATNGAPLTYQWYFDNAALTNATNNTLTITNVQKVNVGNYFVVVADLNGSVTSSVATLNIPGVPNWINNGIVAYYPFNGNANDVTGNGNNGNLGTGIGFTADRFGNPQSALFFTNGIAGQMTTTLPQGGGNVFTLALWFNLPVNYANPGPLYLLCMTDTQTGGWSQVDKLLEVGTPSPNNYLNFYLYPGHQIFLPSPNPEADGRWHQAVATLSPAGMMLYVDGNLVAINANTVSSGLSGYWRILPGQGSVDDVRIYNVALSSDEVAQLYAIESVPIITAQPVSTTNNVGDNVSFGVTSTNAVPLTYQWYFDETAVNNATNSTLSISNVQPVNVGNYYVVVSDFSGSTTSTVVTLNIPGVPNWINDGLVGFYPFNGNANDASATGNNGAVFGATLATDRFGAANQCYYFNGTNSYIQIPPSTNEFGSEDFTISIWFNPLTVPNPSIQVDAACFLISKGQNNFEFSTGSATSPTGMHFLPRNAPGNDWNTPAAAYQTNAWQHVVATYSPSANTVQVYLNGVSLALTGPSITPIGTDNGTPATLGMRSDGTLALNGFLDDVRIYNRALGSTEVSQLYAYEAGTNPPSIAGQPQSITVNATNSASFNVLAYGTPPLNYQWHFNNTNIPGATSSILSISSVMQSNLGNYSVVISNAFGLVTSSNAALSMYPFIKTPFTGVITDWGQNATVSVQAWGTGPLIYQWFDNGVAIQNATNQTLTLDSIQFTNAGLYTVVVSSPLGSVTNAPQQVVVNPAGVSLGLYPGVTVTGTVGYTYDIQASSNLADTNSWVTVATLTLEQPVQLWIDTTDNTTAHTNAARFYRVIPGP